MCLSTRTKLNDNITRIVRKSIKCAPSIQDTSFLGLLVKIKMQNLFIGYAITLVTVDMSLFNNEQLKNRSNIG